MKRITILTGSVGNPPMAVPVSQKHVLVDLDESLRCLDSSERELVLMRFF